MSLNENYYHHNNEYSNFLEAQSFEAFSKYIDTITRLLPSPNASFLDVGCGTGIALSLIRKINPNSDLKGIEISNTSVELAKTKDLDVLVYNGSEIPFPNSNFDIVGSINVIEHVDNVEKFLEEKLRVTKDDGYIVIACPNFLSITNSYHWHTMGIKQKLNNLIEIITKLLSFSYNFKKMPTVQNEVFQPDDDACNVVNPLDIIKWAKKNNLKVIDWSSQLIYTNNPIIRYVDKTPLKVVFGACLFVLQKK